MLSTRKTSGQCSYDESMCHNALPEHVHALAQGGMLWLTQVRVALPEFRGQGTGQFDQPGIAQIGHVQLWHTALAHANKVTRAAQAQVFLGQAKPIVG